MQKKMSAVIIAKNEEQMLAACLETLSFCHKIIVLDTGSTDKTVQIAEHYNCKVLNFSHHSFAKLREKAASLVETEWLFYVDADERVSPALAKEILLHIEQADCEVMSINRKNICYGEHLNYGNWQHDWVTRVFHKEALLSWKGDIHESPVFQGRLVSLQHKLLHLTHRSTQDNLRKSAEWTIKEAQAIEATTTKQITFVNILRKGIMEFYRRALKYRGYKDGMAGLIEALVQAMNRMIVYIQVWELQKKPSLKAQYDKEEQMIKKLWREEGQLT